MHLKKGIIVKFYILYILISVHLKIVKYTLEKIVYVVV